jgi:cytochrome c oxidase subunit II
MVVLMKTMLRAIALIVVASAIVMAMPRRGADAQEPAAQVVEITAERFTFSPSEIRVNAGTRLEIRLRSEDTAHGFRIMGTDIDVELAKRGRGVKTVTFEPKAGRYTFECSQLCGAGHEFMRGVIIAE